MFDSRRRGLAHRRAGSSTLAAGALATLCCGACTRAAPHDGSDSTGEAAATRGSEASETGNAEPLRGAPAGVEASKPGPDPTSAPAPRRDKTFWHPVAVFADPGPPVRRGLVFDVLTDGAGLEMRLVNRTQARVWWCGPPQMLDWVRLEAFDPEGRVLDAAVGPAGSTDAASDGFTWTLAPGATMRVGRVELEESKPDGYRAVLEDGRRLDVVAAAHVSARLEGPVDAGAHTECLQRARARWYAASDFRAEVPWAPAGPAERLFPAEVDTIAEIGEFRYGTSPSSFRLAPRVWEESHPWLSTAR